MKLYLFVTMSLFFLEGLAKLWWLGDEAREYERQTDQVAVATAFNIAFFVWSFFLVMQGGE